jgi:hypothetical protein
MERSKRTPRTPALCVRAAYTPNENKEVQMTQGKEATFHMAAVATPVEEHLIPKLPKQ